MTEDSASGNRWEPVPANRPTDQGPVEDLQAGATVQPGPASQPAPQPAPQPAGDTEVLAATSAEAGRRSLRRTGLLAGVAVVLFLGGGAGGFALGHSAAGDSPAPTGSDPLGHHSGPQGFDPDGDGHGPGPGYGEAPGFGDDGGSGNGTGDGGSSADGTGA